MSKKRDLISIDVLRALAIFAVVIIHVNPFYYDPNTKISVPFLVSYIFQQYCRFALPFFFAASGFFFGRSLNKTGNIKSLYWRYIKRLFFLFISWSIVYDLWSFMNPYYLESIQQYGVLRTLYWHYLDYLKNPIDFVLTGTRAHLWFLMALITSVSMTSLFIHFHAKRALTITSILLYAFALMSSTYSHSPVGLHIGFTTRNGPFFATIFVVMGIWLSNQNKFSFNKAIALVLIGLITQFYENHILINRFDMHPAGQTLFIGTIFMTLGVMMLALKYPQWGEKSVLLGMGRMTLGVYCIHPIIMDICFNFKRIYDAPWMDFVYPVVIYSGSLVTVILLKRYNRIKKLIA